MRLANALGEREAGPRAQIGRVVRVLGIERAETFYQQAMEVEAAGGMMLPNGSQRRTPGGVFFKLVRDGVSEEERLAIFPLRPWQKQRRERGHSLPLQVHQVHCLRRQHAHLSLIFQISQGRHVP